jgi:uncharacterized protein (TIGR02246 family)
MSEEGVRELFGKWRDSLATLDSQQVAERNTRDGVLIPTMSATPRTGRPAVKEFYDSFVLNKPQVLKVLQSFVTVNENWCKDLGVYEFRFGTRGVIIEDRYSFLYVLEDGEWKITHHHSSALPEGLQVAARKASGEVSGAGGRGGRIGGAEDCDVQLLIEMSQDCIVEWNESPCKGSEEEEIDEFFSRFELLEGIGNDSYRRRPVTSSLLASCREEGATTHQNRLD